MVTHLKSLFIIMVCILLSACHLQRIKTSDGTPVADTVLVLEEDYITDYEGRFLGLPEGQAIVKKGILRPTDLVRSSFTGYVFYIGQGQFTKKGTSEIGQYIAVIGINPKNINDPIRVGLFTGLAGNYFNDWLEDRSSPPLTSEILKLVTNKE